MGQSVSPLGLFCQDWVSTNSIVQAWLQQCYQSACEVYSVDPEKTENDFVEGYKSGYTKENYRVQPYNRALEQTDGETDVCAGLKRVHSKNIHPFVVKRRAKLQSPLSE